MLTYEVTVTVESGLSDEFERYMRSKHIPEILATGCFIRIFFERADSGAFRTRYVGASRVDLERYLRDHAQAFRGDFAEHFPSGAVAQRENWTLVEQFG